MSGKVPGYRVSVDPTGLSVVTTTDVQAALAEIDAVVASIGTIPTEASDLTTVILPLTAGTELVFDSDDHLILVEVPYP